jgi:glycosyltransferase involved in cell wall biosynthesis
MAAMTTAPGPVSDDGRRAVPVPDFGALRILITDPHLRGGGQVRYVLGLAGELSRRGHLVTIGCKLGSVLADGSREIGCGLYGVFRYRGGLRPRAWVGDVAALRRFVRAHQPDILHANGSQDHWVSAVTNRIMGRPVCTVRTRHNTYAVRENWPNRKLNLDWTDYQIAVCRAVFDMRASRPVFDERRMCVIHNGVDPERFRPDARLRTEARREFGFSDEHVVLGIAARLAAAKGHRFLFEAAAQLRREFPNIRLLVLGQGVLGKELQGLASDLGINPITVFAGFRDDIGRCIQVFDIGVQPSIDCEASSFSVMEQMATEIPIAASDHGGTKEIVRDGVDGFIVPQGTVTPLAAALRKLLAEPARRREMGVSARRRIVDEFTIERLARRTLEAYREALSVHRHRLRRAES